MVADDTYFAPWNSDFEVITKKKVTVEVIDKSKSISPKKPSVKAIVPIQKNKSLNEKRVTISSVSEKLYKYLAESGITQRAVRTRPKKVTKLVEGFMRKYRFNTKAGKNIIIKALEKIQR